MSESNTNVKVVEEQPKQQLTEKQLKAATLARKTYSEGNIFKIIFKITFPVFILMIVNSLYQMIDTIMAAQLVDYGEDVFGEWAKGAFKGAIAAQYIMPLIMLSMACLVIINVGYGTLFSQKLGANDPNGAKGSTSTALWTTLFLGVGCMVFVICIGPLFIKWNMPSYLFNDQSQSILIPGSGVHNIVMEDLGNTIYKDAYLSTIVYTLTIALSGFQGIVSRQLRAEGHIKSMSYLPLLSIPFNIALDYLFMGVMDMELVGATYATLIAIFITSFTTYAYAMYANKKGTTMFSWSFFGYQLDKKVLGLICLIGMVPFLMQVFRIYDIELASQAIKHLVDNIPLSGVDKFIAIGQWSTFFTAAMRPMMLIVMPGVAVLQAGGAFLGYHFGAKNYHKVNKGILTMLVVMLVYAMPSWIIILIWSKSVIYIFGVGDSINDITNEMVFIDRMIIGFGIMNCFIMGANSYFISTKRHKIGGLMQVINLLFIYTIIVVGMYYAFVGKEEFEYFYLYNSIFFAAQAVVAMLLLGIVLIKDHNRLKKEGHVDSIEIEPA